MQENYRPEIDGLRAIAVVAVILYHTQFIIFDTEIFKGGFIGVDIFFVISGYLISSIIIKELKQTGYFSFKNFYERRIRRLLPALLAVMILSFPLAWLYLLPRNFVEYSQSVLYSLGFSSNFYFWSLGGNYEDTNSLLKPFLHTWSLSVEEQFYIFFPIVLIIIFKYFKNYLIHFLIFAFILSLIISDFGSKNYPSSTFYFLPTRGWELLAGCILAYFEIKIGHRSVKSSLNLFLPCIGLLLIFFSIIFYTDKIFHPSFLTLPPIIGVCLIIWFSSKNDIITKILSSKLFVGVGLISYSLYLWHYPILAFDKISNFSDGGLINKLLITFTIIFLSLITFYFIERPLRDRKKSFKLILTYVLTLTSAITIINSKVISNNGYANRLPEIINSSLIGSNIIDNNTLKINLSTNQKVYLIGDSHMTTLGINLKKTLSNNNIQYHPYILNECLYFPGFDRVRVKTNKKTSTCNSNYFRKIQKELTKQNDSIIIFGGRYPVILENTFFNNREGGVEDDSPWKYKFVGNGKFENIKNSFTQSIKYLSENNTVVLIYPIPEVGWDIQQKLFNGNPKKIISTSFDVFKHRTRSSFKFLDSIESTNVYRIYPHKIFCDLNIKNRCVTHNKNFIFYSDDNHLSLKGAQMLNNLLISKINKIVSN